MTAFDRIQCGIKGLDQAFDNIRMGDNVVWQLTRLEDFSSVVDPFVKQSVADGRVLIYIRFASHEPLVPEQPGVIRYEVDPNEGFETFTVKVRNIITHYGFDAFYVFDCLSELQTAWSTDLMMGNFFRVTCPYLFQLDTVAYFPIIRGSHSFSAVAKIRDTTQLLIDVYCDHENEMYVRPLKVWNRYSPTMFLAHRVDLDTGQARALTESVEASRFYSVLNDSERASNDLNNDSWDRFFAEVETRYRAGTLTEEETTRVCAMMSNMMMTRDARMRKMVTGNFGPEDYFTVHNRMVGTGRIGGKACGMLLARRIVESKLPQYKEHFEPHDSFYIGTDVFYTYIVANDAWALRIAQINEHSVGDAAKALRERFLAGTFPDDIRNGFQRILDYFGQEPIIVRSSSFLEDGFGNAFAGKYESVFCPNNGTPEMRLEDFENAVRQVYASTMDPSALEYRYRNGLDQSEEQMALLVQRVSGSRLEGGSLFMPTAAGVGYSHSAYCWMPELDPDAGMLRLVMGLGTKAVDRTEADYPRIVSLDRPEATPTKNVAERHRFSQKYVDVIDLEKRALCEKPASRIEALMAPYARAAVFERDTEAEQSLRNRGQMRRVLFASCAGLVANRTFTTMMADILSTLQDAYDYPVDIEYAINVGKDGAFVVNLLQCRPLKALNRQDRIELPDLPSGRTLFRMEADSMGDSREEAIDLVVLIDPQRYYDCPYAKKSLVANLVGKANARAKQTGESLLVLAPGRLGTSSPELGVPVTFADISEVSAICEVAYSKAGYSPELSYGSHMFQDLVEAEIFYGALLEDRSKTPIYQPDLLLDDACGFRDITDEVLGAGERGEGAVGALDSPAIDPEVAGIVAVYDAHDTGLTLWHDTVANKSVCGLRES